MHFHGFSRDDLAKENLRKCKHINYLCTADSTSVGGYSFLREKNIICHFKGLFIKIKKFKISMKTPQKWPIKCFSQNLKITSQTCRISGTLVLLCSCFIKKQFRDQVKISMKNPKKWLIMCTDLHLHVGGVHAVWTYSLH